jgi:integrase
MKYLQYQLRDEQLELKGQKLFKHLEAEIADFRRSVEGGSYVKPNKLTFAEIVVLWRTRYANENLSPTTLRIYTSIIDGRLINVFGHVEIVKIKAGHISEYLATLSRKDGKNGTLDAESRKYIYRVLRNVFKWAHVELKSIPDNPMEGISPPRATNDESRAKLKKAKDLPKFYDEAETQTLVNMLYDKAERKWRLLILGALIGGFRRGELLGLEWHNVDWERSGVYIENTVVDSRKGGERIEKGPKTLSSERFVTMPRFYMDEIREYRERWEREKNRLGVAWEGGSREFVFHSGYGCAYYHQHPTRWFKRFCLRHGLRYITFHGLRHTTGTLMIEDASSQAEVDMLLMAVQRKLGHSKLATTTDIYSHVTKKVVDRGTSVFDKFVRKGIGD